MNRRRRPRERVTERRRTCCGGHLFVQPRSSAAGAEAGMRLQGHEARRDRPSPFTTSTLGGPPLACRPAAEPLEPRVLLAAQLLRDINPGALSSNARNLLAIG